MNQIEIVCLIIAGVSVIFGVCGIVFPVISKKGVNTAQVLNKVDSGLEVAAQTVGEIKALAPDTPYISTVESIIKFADQGVKKAEQLYVSNQISADARKAEAIKLTKDLLTAAGVTTTPQIETIIDGCVEAATFVLPQTHTPENEARYAAHTSVQPEQTDAPATVETAQATPDNAQADSTQNQANAAIPTTSGVTIDQLNQAQTIISAAIAEKAATQAATGCEAVASSTTGVGQASV